MKSFFLLAFLLPAFTFGAPPTTVSDCPDALAWQHWREGHFAAAENCAEKNLAVGQEADSALSLLFLTASALGKYESAIEYYQRISPSYPKIGQLDSLVVDAFHHQEKFGEAYAFAQTRKIEAEGYMNFVRELGRKPASFALAETTVIPFANKDILSPYLPDFDMQIAGEKVTAYFDTGAPELIVSPFMAKRLGIKGAFFGWGRANGGPSKIWFAQTDVQLGAVKAKNVPVFIAESLEVEGLRDKAFFGTGFIKHFFTTVDYPRNRLILSPKNDEAAPAKHLAMVGGQVQTMDFALVSDHFMLAKGSLGEHQDLTFFVDTGIVQWRESDLKQPAFLAFTEDLRDFGYDQGDLEKNKFLDIRGGIGLGLLRQENHVLVHESRGKMPSLAGVRIYGLIGHAFLKKYAWTIDFTRRKYIFSN